MPISTIKKEFKTHQFHYGLTIVQSVGFALVEVIIALQNSRNIANFFNIESKRMDDGPCLR